MPTLLMGRGPAGRRAGAERAVGELASLSRYDAD